MLVVGRYEGGETALVQRWALSGKLANAVTGGMRNAMGEPNREGMGSLGEEQGTVEVSSVQLSLAAREEASPPWVVVAVFRAHADRTVTVQEWSLGDVTAEAVAHDIGDQLDAPQLEAVVTVDPTEDGAIELARVTLDPTVGAAGRS